MITFNPTAPSFSKQNSQKQISPHQNSVYFSGAGSQNGAAVSKIAEAAVKHDLVDAADRFCRMIRQMLEQGIIAVHTDAKGTRTIYDPNNLKAPAAIELGKSYIAVTTGLSKDVIREITGKQRVIA